MLQTVWIHLGEWIQTIEGNWLQMIVGIYFVYYLFGVLLEPRKSRSKDWDNSVQKKYVDLLKIHDLLVVKHNLLIDQINAKGGQAFLDGESSEFTPEEIKDLIVLCHPDKHGDSQKSVKLTQKLLNLRGESK